MKINKEVKMKILKIYPWFLVLLVFFFYNNLLAQQLVYTPINPSFGGSSFNGSWLLALAQAENRFTASSYNNYYNTYNSNSLNQFTQNLNNQILSQLSSKIIKSVFGEDNITKGHYELGNYIVDINPSNDGIHINILDNSTGDQTNIIVPFY